MPRRRDKRTDTENSDDYEEKQAIERVVHFGTVRFNRMLAPDQIEGDDSSRYSILAWSNTLQAQRLLPWNERKQLFHRAISFLPYSYKIWHMFLSQFIDFCSSRSLLSKQYKQLNTAFEEALVKLPRMPRIWLLYSQTLQKQHLVSKTRQVYNWSFRNLPLTQHEKIWKKFAEWSMRLDNNATAISVVPRYLKLNPDFKEQYAEFLRARNLHDRRAAIIQAIIDDQGYHSKAGLSKKDFYLELVDLISQNPDEIKCLNGEEAIRSGLAKYTEESGRLWVKLSDYFIRKGQFDAARNVLEEAIQAIDNSKDFGIIFNAYVKFQEEMITALASEQIREAHSVVEQDNVDYEIQRRLEKLQALVDRQPYLLHKISLRKNPNQVKPWLGLVSLHRAAGRVSQIFAVIEEALSKIQPEEVEGKFSEIWIQYARELQKSGNLARCNEILHQATSVNFRLMEDYLMIWRRWAETLLQEGFYEDALKVVKQILFRRRPITEQADLRVKNIDELLKGNSTLWQLYIDLQINVGTFQTVRIAYERCKEHRCLTPIMLLNFTNFLWEGAYFEETFRAFEFAVGHFKWPSLKEIWLAYISKFLARHGSSAAGVQRARSMFERLLRDLPQEHRSIFYFIYAEFQEQYGLYSHAVDVYDRMVKAVPQAERYQAYSIYISKVSKLLGITKTRPVFQASLKALTEKEVLEVGQKYAELQTNLGELERARAVYGYISQFTDPRDDSDNLWEIWQRFQVQYGDKESYKEYLRIKRSVTAKFDMLPPDLDKIEANVKRGLA